MRHVIREHCHRGAVAATRMTRVHLVRHRSLLAPQKQASLGPLRGERVERGLVSALVEEFWVRFLLRPADGDRFPADHACHLRGRVIEIANEDGFCGTHNHTGGLQPHVDAVCAEITLLRGMVLGIDKDRVVGAGGDARLAADADRFVKIHDAIGTRVHCPGRAGGGTGRVLALITARHLKGAPHLREDAHVNIFDVGTVDGERHLMFRLARRAAGMAADTLRVVDDFRPLGWQCRCGDRFFHVCLLNVPLVLLREDPRRRPCARAYHAWQG